MRKLKKKCHQLYLLSREFFCYIIYLARDKRQICQNGHDYNFVGVVRSPLRIRNILLLAQNPIQREFRCDGLLHTIFSNSVQLYKYNYHFLVLKASLPYRINLQTVRKNILEQYKTAI